MDARRSFRLDNEVLAFRFTATVSDRASTRPRERLLGPEFVALWLDAVGLAVPRVTDADVESVIALRESIYRVGAALAQTRTPAPDDVLAVNQHAAAGRAAVQFDGDTAAWQWGDAPLADALGVLATDAIHVFGARDRAPVRLCEGPGCAGLFVDGSRGRNRRWCSMNTCGNRMKKARLATR